MTVRWQLYDALVPETFTFELNPSDGGSPPFKKTLTYQNTAAPQGKTLVFEGRDEVQPLTFSGTLLSQAQHDAFVTWFDKRHQVLLTDDLGRQYWVYITSFTPKRVRAASHPWKQTYDLECVILDWGP